MDENEQKMYAAIKELTGNELPISRIEGFEPKWENTQQSVSGSLKNNQTTQTTHKNNVSGMKPQMVSGYTPDMPQTPHHSYSRRRSKERRTCALLQRNFGVI